MNKSDYNEIKGGMETNRMWPDKDSPLKKGDTIEGRYVEKKENVGDNNSIIYVLEVGNEVVGVWGTTVLDTKLSGIAIGKMVGIEYLGKSESKKGGREYHDFWVGEGVLIPGDEGEPF